VKSFLLGVSVLSTALFLSSTANAGANDESFVRKFMSYRAKHNVSTYRAAKAFANHLKKNPEQILKRYLSAAYSIGGPTQEAAVVHVIDAFKESGMSHDMALTKVSDSVGQMTDTLDSIYQRVSGGMKNPTRNMAAPAKAAGRGLASVRAK